MDRKSLEVLELPKVLKQLADYTAFSASRELALALSPSSDHSMVERWQELTAEGVALLGTRPDFSIRGAEDIRPLVDRAERGGLLEAGQLAAIARTIESGQFVGNTLVQLNTDRYPELCAFGSAISPLRDLHRTLRSAISDDGQILDSASPELHRLRSEIRTAQLRIQERLQSYLNTHRSALQDTIITMRDDRYVLPVRADARNQLPGIVHDQSASGATVFIEPLAVVELNNAIRTLQIQERHEIERILTELSRQVGHEAAALQRNVISLAAIDLALAKARYAVAHNAVRPILMDETVIELREARHPLLRGTVVPLTLSLGREWTQIVITGPNTGGKTVALRTVGLLTAMALSGLHIPAAEGSVIGAIGGVWADIGDEQSIEQSLSTFSSHLTTIIRMLQGLQTGDLVVLDELGAGTDPVEGSALARAVLSHLQQHGVLTLATTHYAELKAYAQVTPGIQNASMEFNVETLSPTYRL
ncbi:MAG: endonuclease MutS2, partial [Chloroflexi bacterium]|nr:endonuclease MutS2 [Chloroflexota bacterium]